MKLTWTEFAGISPRIDPRVLPNGIAQVADNTNTERGGVRGLEGVRDIMPLAKTGVRTIYRFGQGMTSETQYWFHWDKDVHVIKGPIADDTSERTFWTGDGAPKYTTAQLGLSGSNLPSGWRALGVARPSTAPIAHPEGELDDAEEEMAGSENRVYVYTFVSDMGEESAPSDPVTVTIRDGQSVKLQAMETASPNAAVLASKRIYRAQRGLYLFVAEVPVGAQEYVDELGSDLLGEPCPSTTWDMPPETMHGLIAGSGGVCAALDTEEPYSVLFCDPYHLHAWPHNYQQTVDYPTVALGHFGQSYVVLTTGHPYVLTGLHPRTMSMSPAKFYQPCVSSRSVVSAMGDIIWASPDGLVSLGNSGELVLTADVFTAADWRTRNPETILGSWHEGWYVGSWEDDAGIPRGFMFNPATREWVDLPHISPRAMFRDTVGDALFMVEGGRLVKFRGGAVEDFVWRGQEVVTPLVDFAVARVTGTHPIGFKLLRDGVQVYERTVPDDEPFKIPAGLGRSWEVEVYGSGVVLGIALSTAEVDI